MIETKDPANAVLAYYLDYEEGVCETCGCGYRATVAVLGLGRIKSRNCQECVEREEQRLRGEVRDPSKRREDAWRRVCPPEYHDTDPERLRGMVGEEIFQGALAWPMGSEKPAGPRPPGAPGKPGLGIIGRTGRGKTRLMFLLLRPRVLAGDRLRYLNAVHLADELASIYSSGCDEAERWMRSVESAPLLFIDDLGKEKLTERMDTFYYRCTEFRTAHRLPIFYTSNLDGSELQARWDAAATSGNFWADRAAPTIRRLRESRGVLML